MVGKERQARPDEMLDVRRAAAHVGRHPETVRRWVWSGRLAARREGNRLIVARAEVEALAGAAAPIGLAAWADHARRAREAAGLTVAGASAADLVLEDRSREPDGSRAGR